MTTYYIGYPLTLSLIHISLNYLAKEERQKQITEIIADKIADQENSPEEILINEELFSHYVKALDRLPEKCREIFCLLYTSRCV